MLQTGHCRDVNVWDKVTGDYLLDPVKPVLNAEPIYEEHPVCFNAKANGYSNAYDIRKAAYLSVFAGSFGFTYGCHAVWQFYAPPREPINGPQRPWQESLELEGAGQLKHLKNLMTTYLLTGLSPDQSMIKDAGDSTERIQAIRGKNHLMVYTAGGKAIGLIKGKISGKMLTGFWYDPKNGKKHPVKSSSNIGEETYTPPSTGKGNDWVLVLTGK
jgi:hypothetical protein